MDFSQFENELKKYRSGKLTRKDYNRLEEDMLYVTTLFLASNGKLGDALDFSCCDGILWSFKTLLMGNDATKQEGISKPTSNEVSQYCICYNECELVKGKDKSASLKKAFQHMPKFGLKEGTADEIYENVFYEISLKDTILLLQKNKNFIKGYYEYIFKKHPELDSNDKALMINPLSPELVEPMFDEVGGKTSGTTRVNQEARMYFKYQKVVDLLIKELGNYYQDVPAYREVITSTYNKALQEGLKLREKRIKQENIYRITNVIEYLTYMGYIDEAIKQNNSRALKYGLYPNLLCVSEDDNAEALVPKDSLNEIKRNANNVSLSNEALYSAFCLLNPEWKNKSLEEQAQMTLEKVCFPVEKLLDEKYYQDFSLEELLVCSAFYMNRLEKLSERVLRGAFLHDKLHTLYDSVESGEIPDSVHDRMPDALKQRNFMLDLVMDKFMDTWKNTGFTFDSYLDPGALERIKTQNVATIPNDLETKYKDAYQKYFSVYLKNSKHDVATDYTYFFNVRNLSQTIYILKDMSLESLMMVISSGKSKINFGLIPEEQETVSEYGEPQVLLGIDCENMPTVRLHYPKNEFERVKEKYYKDREFPNYYCPDDLKIGDADMTTPLVYKFTKGAKQLLHKMYSGMDSNLPMYKFIRRMYWNIHPNQNPLNSKKKEIRALANKKNSDNPNDTDEMNS